MAITRWDLSAPELRQTAARRMLALALVMEGADRVTAARSCGMDRQTLRDWGSPLQFGWLGGIGKQAVAGAFTEADG